MSATGEEMAVLTAQADDDGGDTSMPVILWTLVAAGGAGGIGLILFVVRAAMGWVRPPPAQDEGHH